MGCKGRDSIHVHVGRHNVSLRNLNEDVKTTKNEIKNETTNQLRRIAFNFIDLSFLLFIMNRSDSPPIPTMRNKNSSNDGGGGGGGDDNGGGSGEVVEQLSTMRKELDRKQEEHDAVWNGLVEV